MHRLKQFFHKLSIRKKMLTILCLVGMLPVMILGISLGIIPIAQCEIQGKRYDEYTAASLWDCRLSDVYLPADDEVFRI